SSERKQDDAIVARNWPTARIAVAREDEEVSARQLEHVAQPSELVHQQTLLERDRPPVRPEHDAVQMRPAERREEERAMKWTDLRHERRARGRPRVGPAAPDDRIDEA